jgi:hypothetical protein
MYIGRYNNFYTAYAINPANLGYRKQADGSWIYIGLQGAGNSSTGTGKGSTQAAARADFCRKYGYKKPDGSRCCYGDSGCQPHDTIPATITTRTRTPTGSVERVSPNPASPKYNQMVADAARDNANTTDGCNPRPCPPPTNKTDIIGYWNMGACHFGNLTCHKLPDWGFTVVAGLGGVLLLVLLTKRRR